MAAIKTANLTKYYGVKKNYLTNSIPGQSML